MVTRQCAFCGNNFEAKRSDAKCCSDRCRQKNFQARARGGGINGASVPPTPVTPPGATPSIDGIFATVEANLRAAGQLDTVAGQAAMGLAEHLSRGAISGSERAALTKSLHETMTRAMAAADADPDDPLESIVRRVRAKRGQALDGEDAPSRTPSALIDFEVWQQTHPIPDELVGASVGPIWDCHFDTWCAARKEWAEQVGWPGGQTVRESAERDWLSRRPFDYGEI